MLSKIEQAVLKAGKHLNKGFNSSKEVSYKGKIDLVTQYDVEVEKILLDELSSLSSKYGFVAEETSKDATDMENAIYIDPIDGTTNFVHGFPFCCISVGVYEAGEGVCGVVYNPVMNELFTAVKGEGAFLNGERIYASVNDDLSTSLIATGFPYAVVEERPEGVLRILGDVLTKSRGIRRAGSAALDLCYTAKGVFNGYYEFNLSPWDIAAGAVIASEAGAVVSGRDVGADLDLYERFIIAAGKGVHEELLRIIYP